VDDLFKGCGIPRGGSGRNREFFWWKRPTGGGMGTIIQGGAGALRREIGLLVSEEFGRPWSYVLRTWRKCACT